MYICIENMINECMYISIDNMINNYTYSYMDRLTMHNVTNTLIPRSQCVGTETIHHSKPTPRYPPQSIAVEICEYV